MTANPLVAALEKTTAEAMASGKPLAARLRMIADQVRELSPEFARAVETFVGRLNGAEAGRARRRKSARVLPAFVLPDQNGRLRFARCAAARGSRRGRVPARALVPLLPHYSLGARRDCRKPRAASAHASSPSRREFRQFACSSTPTPRARFRSSPISTMATRLSVNLAIWVDEAMSSPDRRRRLGHPRLSRQ